MAAVAISPGGALPVPTQPTSVNGQSQLPVIQHRPGYPDLSKLMSGSPEIAIFRSFRELNLITVLRLQAELNDLEEQLHDIRMEDCGSGDDVRADYTRNFRLMRDYKDDGDSLQYDMLVSIGKKLDEYNKALAQARQVCLYDKPSRRDITFLQTWLVRPSMGADFLMDQENSIWSEENEDDLITIYSGRSEHDHFTDFLRGALLDLYHWAIGSRKMNAKPSAGGRGYRKYGEERIAVLSDMLTVTASSLLPTLAILVLHFVTPTLVRLGLVILFTAVFSLALSIFTTAKRVEIFSATAA